MGGIRLWGLTRLELRDFTIEAFPSVKSRQLLEILALTPGVPVGKESLADLLWDGAPPPSSGATLESHVCRVRRLLGTAGLPEAIVTVSGGYMLAAAVGVDLVEMRRELVATLDLPVEEACHRLAELAPLPSATLLASSPFAPYAESARRETAALIATALRHACDGALRQEEKDLAVWLSRRALEEQPLCDSNALAAMRSLMAIGATCEALRTYADFRQGVRDELGVEPGHEIRRYYLSVLDRTAHETGEGERVERALLTRLLSSTIPGRCPHRTAVGARGRTARRLTPAKGEDRM